MILPRLHAAPIWRAIDKRCRERRAPERGKWLGKRGRDRMADPAVKPKGHRWERSYPSDISWHAEIPVAPLHRLMDEAVEKFADRPCIDFMDKRYTYAQIGALVDRAARGFQALGVRKGSKVGL